MNTHFKQVISNATEAKRIEDVELIQRLWSGYGSIVRYKIYGGTCDSVVVKHVQLPDAAKHPRGWNTNLSHERKVTSYKVETAFYKKYAQLCDASCYLPSCLALDTWDDEVLLVLEDLDASGFPVRKSSVAIEEMKLCLEWLANFHATFLTKKPDGLWPIGTYWHLDTRPDELLVLDDIPLKQAATAIDQKLNSCKYLTFVHGDAKLANFCFSNNGEKVSAVDFQYVGGGCGMKDVAYFIGSCLYEEDCEKYEDILLASYFSALSKALNEKNKDVVAADVVNEWRSLYAVAWTDFHRFMKGWSPGHWKIHSYSERLAQRVVSELKK